MLPFFRSTAVFRAQYKILYGPNTNKVCPTHTVNLVSPSQYYQHSWAVRFLRHHILTFGPTHNKDDTVAVSLVFVDLTSYTVSTISLTCDKQQTSHTSAIPHHCHLDPQPANKKHIHSCAYSPLYSPVCNSQNPHFTLPLLFPTFIHSERTTINHEWYKLVPYSKTRMCS
jgi:hypothetical protein